MELKRNVKIKKVIAMVFFDDNGKEEIVVLSMPETILKTLKKRCD